MPRKTVDSLTELHRGDKLPASVLNALIRSGKRWVAGERGFVDEETSALDTGISARDGVVLIHSAFEIPEYSVFTIKDGQTKNVPVRCEAEKVDASHSLLLVTNGAVKIPANGWGECRILHNAQPFVAEFKDAASIPGINQPCGVDSGTLKLTKSSSGMVCLSEALQDIYPSGSTKAWVAVASVQGYGHFLGSTSAILAPNDQVNSWTQVGRSLDAQVDVSGSYKGIKVGLGVWHVHFTALLEHLTAEVTTEFTIGAYHDNASLTVFGRGAQGPKDPTPPPLGPEYGAILMTGLGQFESFFTTRVLNFRNTSSLPVFVHQINVVLHKVA